MQLSVHEEADGKNEGLSACERVGNVQYAAEFWQGAYAP